MSALGHRSAAAAIRATDARARRRGRCSDEPAPETNGEDVGARLAERAADAAAARLAGSAAVREYDELDYRETYAIATGQGPEALFASEVGYWPCDCPEWCRCAGDTAAKITERRA
jgi:alkylation response protein AidB-like acyl-CoA dehydrogenase